MSSFLAPDMVARTETGEVFWVGIFKLPIASLTVSKASPSSYIANPGGSPRVRPSRRRILAQKEWNVPMIGRV
ncbi:MAG: hypothetical protein ACD_24C00309G0001 [uncultured bacterium]|nr:MAG: hypothetical protein ACD_24C00309G0001 [uncultured bacterium]